MQLRKFFLLTSWLFILINTSAQDKSNVKYGKISPQDFDNKVYSIDSNASAVVIADIGSTEIVGNSKGWFSLEFKHYRRVHILNKNGYEAGKVEIELFTNGEEEEELESLKAITYNLENGKVVESKLEKNNVFKDRVNKYQEVKKFTFPNVKEGSIIEYEYKVHSDFLFNLQPWEFQGEYPVLWSEYNLSRPEFLGYVILSQGQKNYFVQDQNQRRETYKILDTRGTSASETYSLDANVTDYRWVMKNVPSIKEESFTSSIMNYIARINFQFSDYRYPLTPKSVIDTWPHLCSDLLKDEDFGAALNKNNGWLGDFVKPLLAGANDNMEKAKKIYAYVRDNITCTSHSSKYLSQPLKNILKVRNGSVADVNLLLIAMLNYAGISSDPIILSTRDHGLINPVYPDLEKFNYVICLLHINGKDFYLDASWPRLGFGRLTPICYNGHARIVNEEGTATDLSPDSLVEKKATSILLTEDDKGNIIGSMQQMPGYYESHSIREEIKEKGQEDFFKSIKKAYGEDVSELSNTKVDSLDNLEQNINIAYNFKMNVEKGNLIYLNPMLGEGYKQNPFKSAERLYPVEMPYTMDETYIFSMIIPDGYDVDEMPKPTVIKFNEEGDAYFEYRISRSGETISLRSRIVFKRTFFLPEEYEVLREFFNLIVKKQNEQIVLKKK